MRRSRSSILLGVLAACGTSTAGRDAPTRDDLPIEVGDHGYAVHGVNLYPPLLRRVVAVPCERHDAAACASDADCGPGAACVCGGLGPTRNTCLPAECQTDDTCGDEPCFLSYAVIDDPARFPPGLYCGRRGSRCESGGDCLGNGNACVYVPVRDRFECTHGP